MRDDLPRIGVSTSWNAARRGGLSAAVEELIGLGVGLVELDAPAGTADAQAAARLLVARRLPCAAVAYPLGAGAGLDRYLHLAAEDEASRARALGAARATIDLASRARSRVIVLDGGWVDVAREGGEHALAAAEATGELDAVRRAVLDLLARRRAARDGALERLCRSLFELTRAEPGVWLALRPPADVLGLPHLDELELVLGEFSRAKVGLWHDVARAAVAERRGMGVATRWTDVAGDACRGSYLSDVAGFVGGLPPGAGHLDWREIAAVLPARIPRILKLSPSSSTVALREGLRMMSKRDDSS